jgi:hypothetical protein
MVIAKPIHNSQLLELFLYVLRERFPATSAENWGESVTTAIPQK